ncbi:MAG TPA: metallophosphoesterase family protein, partial [Terriglobales bacterium]|nr:metallophosphoesterase family protein [Terriglobales bacterium]
MIIPLRLSRSLAVLVVLSGIVLLAGSSFAAPQVDVMVKSPYLIYPGVVGQMEVLWQLSGTYTSTVEWGTDLTYSSGSASSTEYGTANQHAYTFTDLLPATKYYYRITTLGTPYTGSFLSAPPSDTTRVKFLVYGDTRPSSTSGPADEHNTEAGVILAAINADPAYQTFTLFMGDYVYNGCTESFWSSQWFPFNEPNIRTLTANLPYAGCMGNHETYPTGSTSLFPKYFPYPFAGSRYYYSFDYGPA